MDDITLGHNGLYGVHYTVVCHIGGKANQMMITMGQSLMSMNALF